MPVRVGSSEGLGLTCGSRCGNRLCAMTLLKYEKRLLGRDQFIADANALGASYGNRQEKEPRANRKEIQFSSSIRLSDIPECEKVGCIGFDSQRVLGAPNRRLLCAALQGHSVFTWRQSEEIKLVLSLEGLGFTID